MDIFSHSLVVRMYLLSIVSKDQRELISGHGSGPYFMEKYKRWSDFVSAT